MKCILTFRKYLSVIILKIIYQMLNIFIFTNAIPFIQRNLTFIYNHLTLSSTRIMSLLLYQMDLSIFPCRAFQSFTHIMLLAAYTILRKFYCRIFLLFTELNMVSDLGLVYLFAVLKSIWWMYNLFPFSNISWISC